MPLCSTCVKGINGTNINRTLDLYSLEQIDADIRQINYFIDGLDESGPVKVVVQLNCRTGMHKLISMGEGANAIPLYDDEPWMNMGSDVDDKKLLLTACGDKGSQLLRNAPIPEYPATALREAREGIARYRITIAPTGTVINCEITATSGHADLDAATCDYAKRKALAVPRGAAAAERSYESSVRWQLPK
jgi:TonB family protein